MNGEAASGDGWVATETTEGRTSGYGSEHKVVDMDGISAGWDYYYMHCWISPKSDVRRDGQQRADSEDLVRRSLHVRLEPGVERPEQRTNFRYPELLPHVAAHRPRYLSDALTVLRAYFVAGCPKVAMRPMGSYEEWSRVVRGALSWAHSGWPASRPIRMYTFSDRVSEH